MSHQVPLCCVDHPFVYGFFRKDQSGLCLKEKVESLSHLGNQNFERSRCHLSMSFFFLHRYAMRLKNFASPLASDGDKKLAVLW